MTRHGTHLIATLTCLLASSLAGLSVPVIAAEEAVEAAQAPPSPIREAGFDPAVRPQDDFYAHVNGAWLRSTTIPPDKSMVGMFDTMGSQASAQMRDLVEELSARTDHPAGSAEQQVGDYFRAYMDSDRAEELATRPIQDLLDAVRDATSPGRLFALGARLGREGVEGPLRVHVDADFGDSTRYSATLFPYGLTLRGSRAYLGDDEEFVAMRAALSTYFATLLRLAGFEDAEARGRAVTEIETQLATIQEPAEALRDIGGYNPYDVSDLDTLAPGIGWAEYLDAAGLGGQERIVIRSPEYVASLGKLLDGQPAGPSLDQWKDYWRVRILHSHAEMLPEAFVEARFGTLDRQVRGAREMPPRSDRAIRRVQEDLEWPLAQLYVARHLSPEAREYLDELIDELTAAFERAIDGSQWMGDGTKARAREKLAKMSRRIACPDVWPDYSALRIASDDAIGNARRARSFTYDLDLAMLSRPFDPAADFSVPLWVTGTYDVTSNAIEFTAPLLQPPLFILGADDAYNYAAIGQVIGHEMGHGFDDEGRKFDADGTLNDWWTEEDARRYQERADRLAVQYSRFEPLEGFPVDGLRTLGENISDLTALNLGYDAYLHSHGDQEPPVVDGYTGRQRYFLSYALTWRNKFREEVLRQRILTGHAPPPEVRVNGPLRNFEPFYEAFGVEEGDGMWLPPAERVEIW